MDAVPLQSLVTVEPQDGAWRVWLHVGCQHFAISDVRHERKLAEWLADQLRKALKNIPPTPAPATCPICYSTDRAVRNVVGEATHGVDPGDPCADEWHRSPAPATKRLRCLKHGAPFVRWSDGYLAVYVFGSQEAADDTPTSQEGSDRYLIWD